MKIIKIIMLILAVVLPLPSAIAANLLSNGGFESPGAVTTYQFLSNNDSTSVTGWTAIDDAVGEKPYLMYKNRSGGSYTNRVIEGLYAVAINQGSGITTTFPVTAGVTYTLSFQSRKGTTAGYTPLEVSVAGFTATFPNVTGTFQQFTYTFTASATDAAAVLMFMNTSPTPDYKTYDLDAVVVEEGTGPVVPPNPFIGNPASSGDPTFTSTHFSGSENCAFCHNGIKDKNNADVSIVTDWSSSMMANASRDPFWRAKVRRETARHPELESVINDRCTRCHAPMAHVEADKAGITQGVFEGGILEAGHANHNAALDGVSCTLCHQIPDSPNLGTLAGMSGNFDVNNTKTIYGPFGGPGETAIFPNPMIMHTGYTPTYSAHVKESKLCASCHNLKTPYVDESGNILSSTPESEFPEQTPYMEWEHSSYVSQKSCQGCHMSRTDGVIMTTRPPWYSVKRDNFALHDLVGANKLMLDILSNNKTQLGVLSNNFAETLSKTDAMLKSAAAVTVVEQPATPNALDFTLQIASSTGHKLPTSYPSRRAILHVTVTNSLNQVVFESGKVNADGSVVGVDADEQSGVFEPHYDLITSADQVQVYESIMGNNLGDVTYTLLRGKEYLKDNRILPLGFNKATAPSDVRVVGEALADSNFVGGSDQISYRVSGLPAGNYTVKAELVYQTLSHAFAQDLFTDTVTPEVVDFKTMFDASTQKSTVIASAEFAGTVIVPVPDTDGDGVADNLDNCKLVANANQRNTDSDRFGNICDPDFNQNNIVDPTDLSRLKSLLGKVSPNGHEDLNGNGIVDPTDFSIAKSYLGKAPGPSGIAP